MLRVVLALLLSATSSQDINEDVNAEVFNSPSAVRDQFNELVGYVAGPAPVLNITSNANNDGLVADGAIFISRETIASARSREELSGLLAYLIAQATPLSSSSSQQNAPSLTTVLAAGAAIAVGETIAPRDEKSLPPELRRQYRWSAGSSPRMAGTERGRLALALMTRSRTCSGAALALMKRLAEPADLIQGPPVRFLSKAAVRDFGSLAAPPDVSCIE